MYIEDEVYKKSKEKKWVEILIQEGDTRIWMPAAITDLRILNRERELVRVIGLRVQAIAKK